MALGEKSTIGFKEEEFDGEHYQITFDNTPSSGSLTRYAKGDWKYSPGGYIQEFNGDFIIAMADFMRFIDKTKDIVAEVTD